MPNQNDSVILLYTDPADGVRKWTKFPDENSMTVEVDRIDAAYPGFADMDGNTVEGPDSPGWLAFDTDAAYGPGDQLPAESESDLWYVVYTDGNGSDTWAAYEGVDAAASAAAGLQASLPAPVAVYSYCDYAF